MPTTTLNTDLIPQELKARLRDLDVTTEYFLDLLSKNIVDLPVTVMMSLMDAKRAIEAALREYESYVKEAENGRG